MIRKMLQMAAAHVGADYYTAIEAYENETLITDEAGAIFWRYENGDNAATVLVTHEDDCLIIGAEAYLQGNGIASGEAGEHVFLDDSTASVGAIVAALYGQMQVAREYIEQNK